MAPVPLEGHQTPVTNNIPQEGNRGGSISLGMLIDFIIQRTYHELTVLAELYVKKKYRQVYFNISQYDLFLIFDSTRLDYLERRIWSARLKFIIFPLERGNCMFVCWHW